MPARARMMPAARDRLAGARAGEVRLAVVRAVPEEVRAGSAGLAEVRAGEPAGRAGSA